MRLRIFVLAVLALALLSGCEKSSPVSAPKGGVGVVNFTRLVQESEAGQAAQKHIETVAAEMQEKVMALQESGDMARMQMAFAMFQESTNVLQEQAAETFNKAVTAAADKLRTAKGLDCILTIEASVSHSPEADLTDAMIAELNKASITYPTPEFDLSALFPEEDAAEGAEGTEGAASEAPAQ